MDETLFCVGQVTAGDGAVVKYWRDGTPSLFADVPATAFNQRQPVDVQVVRAHDETWARGTLRYLERDDRGDLWAVCTVTRAAADEWPESYFSAALDGIVGEVLDGNMAQIMRHVGHANIRHLSLGPTTAQIHNRPVRFYTQTDGSDLPPGRHAEIAHRAKDAVTPKQYIAAYQRPTHLPIVEPEPDPPRDRMIADTGITEAEHDLLLAGYPLRH